MSDVMRYLALGAAGLWLAACSDSPASETAQTPAPIASGETAGGEAASKETASEEARLSDWFEATFEERVQRSPEFLARLGRMERNDEWDDVSREAELERLDWTRRKLAELEHGIDRDALGPDAALSYDLWVANARDAIEADRWHAHAYPFNQMFGAQSRVGPFLTNQHPIRSVEDADAYIARLRGVDDKLDTILARSVEATERGLQPPRFVYDHVLRDARNMLAGQPLDAGGDVNLVFADFSQKIDALDIGSDTRERLLAEATDALQTDYRRGFEAVIAEMERQQALATTDDGVWKLPDGEAYYAWQLGRYTTTDMSADEIHQLGLDEVQRIHGEMREIINEVGFEGDLQDFFAHLRTDPAQFYPNSDAGREAYLADAKAMIDAMAARVPEVFLFRPDADLDVRRVEPFREESAGKAFYNAPSLDGTRPGIYYANLHRMGDMPKYQMEALAYHEGIPGHHMQFAVTQKLDGIPRFRRFNRVTAHSEGWGLYSEYLPKEMGFYEDPYSDFGRLAMELWRAARLVVDMGLHHKRWTREDTIDYLKANTPNPEGDIVKSTERYIVMPGQATAYMIGKIKILDERERAREALGERFDIREFHDVVLASGPVPLDVMEARVSDYIALKREGAYQPPAYD